LAVTLISNQIIIGNAKTQTEHDDSSPHNPINPQLQETKFTRQGQLRSGLHGPKQADKHNSSNKEGVEKGIRFAGIIRNFS